MSQGVVADPVVTRSGTVKIATPTPVTGHGIVVNPVVVQWSGPITVTPEAV